MVYVAPVIAEFGRHPSSSSLVGLSRFPNLVPQERLDISGLYIWDHCVGVNGLESGSGAASAFIAI